MLPLWNCLESEDCFQPKAFCNPENETIIIILIRKEKIYKIRISKDKLTLTSRCIDKMYEFSLFKIADMMYRFFNSAEVNPSGGTGQSERGKIRVLF